MVPQKAVVITSSSGTTVPRSRRAAIQMPAARPTALNRPCQLRTNGPRTIRLGSTLMTISPVFYTPLQRPSHERALAPRGSRGGSAPSIARRTLVGVWGYPPNSPLLLAERFVGGEAEIAGDEKAAGAL